MTGHDLSEGELYRSGYSQRMDLTETDLVAPEILTSLPTGQAIVTSQGFPPIKIKAPLLEKSGGAGFFERLETLYGSPPKPEKNMVREESAAKEAGRENFPLDWLNTPYAEKRQDQEEPE
jgi:type IV secretory pathway TraG/TraD family ATPase VirD4